MLKMLIAEDEPKILAGLQKQIENMQLDVEITDTAQDGEEALEKAKRCKPDILLVDICMPFLNGLELIEKLYETGGNFKVIVISGYGEFEYAKRSVELSVYAYILKPVDLAELKLKLEQLIGEIKKEKNKNKYFEFAVAQTAKHKDTLIQTFLHDAAVGKYSPDEIKEHCAFFGININLAYNLVLIKVPAEIYEMHRTNEILLPPQIESVLKQLLNEPTDSYLFPDDRGNLLLLYRQNPAYRHLCSRIKDAVKEELGIGIHTESVELISPERLNEAYDELIGLLFDDKKFSPLVLQALNYIAKGYTRHDFGLEETAEEIGITPAYLSRLLKNELGTSFSHYVSQLRIRLALELMNKGLLIKDVASRCGFGSPFYFSTAFKKILNMPPNAYRIKKTEGKMPDET